MNKVIMVGNVVYEPELKTTNSGVNVCRFRLAVKRPDDKDTTDFIDCVAWRKTGELIDEYVAKGDKIGVDGYLTIRQYDGNDGTKKTAVEIVVEEFEFMGKRTLTPPGLTVDDSTEPSPFD